MALPISPELPRLEEPHRPVLPQLFKFEHASWWPLVDSQELGSQFVIRLIGHRQLSIILLEQVVGFRRQYGGHSLGSGSGRSCERVRRNPGRLSQRGRGA
jgi:hypothetical protein